MHPPRERWGNREDGGGATQVDKGFSNPMAPQLAEQRSRWWWCSNMQILELPKLAFPEIH